MLTISKPLGASQAQRYHREDFRNARENYYTQGDTIRGEWHGRLADQWGLAGEVDERLFARLAEGQHPLTSEQLVRHQVARDYVNPRGERVTTMEHRAGWDATFSAPKSVSLTALVGGDERVRQAHRESVEIALSELERYVQARMGGNRPSLTTGKWVAARFDHDSARPVDGYAAPQLHTHVVVFNLTELKDGETRALQPRELYRAQQYGTAVYRSELASRLRADGYEIERGKNGQPEIKGYTREYIEASSPRRRQIEQHLEEMGFSGAGPAQIAAHQTRGAKLDLTHAEMLRRHQELAAQHGHQPERVVREARQRVAEQTEEQVKERAIESAISYAREKCLEREAVVDERDLMREALGRSMGEARFRDVRAELQRRVAAGELVEREAAVGRSFTTAEMVRCERENICMMRAGQGQHEELATPATRRKLEETHFHLSANQRAAVGQVLSNRDRVMGLEGVAGSGKTTSLAAIRDAAEREGYRVEGFAPTSRAAQQLEDAGIPSTTLQRHLARGAEVRDGRRHLYVLDESSLAGTKQMNDFLRLLGEHDRVLLVGDVRQHQAVEAGRPYQQLQEAGMQTASLNEIVRQKDPALKEAVERLAGGYVKEALQDLDRQSRFHEIVGRDERFNEIARQYAERPEGTLVISPDNRSRQEMNALIRQEMQARGHVGREEHRIRILEQRSDLTGADRAWAEKYELGDTLRYSKGSKQLGIEKGEYGRVVGVDAKESRLTVECGNGECLTYDPRRLQGVAVYRAAERSIAQGERVQFTAPSHELGVANRALGRIDHVDKNDNLRIRMDSGREVAFNLKQHPHLDHGYAVTSHSSQGQTAHRVLIHLETGQGERLMNSRTAYVSISRARHDVQIYTNDKPGLVRELSRDVSQRTALGEVAQKAVQAPSLVPSPQQAVLNVAAGAVVARVKQAVHDVALGRAEDRS